MKTYRGAGIAFFRQKDGRYEVFLGKRLPAMQSRNELFDFMGVSVMSAVEKFKTVSDSLADK